MENKYLDIVPDDRQIEDFEPAIKYPFKLDNFQRLAQYYIQKGENVLITAHTSAGKTVIAESGIANAKKADKRAFYTSPIKTLSNQKYSEFSKKFGDVGLLTGDIKCKPDAQCVIMTTEILRDMLYKDEYQNELKNLGYVIFDEVHYINNPERGHVWEECLVKLPREVILIMLSATISESYKFAEWIGQLKKKPIHLITTLNRPVPLNHYAYYNDKLELILDNKGNFYDRNYQTYYQGHSQSLKKARSNNQTNILNPFIEHLKKNNLNPAIFFVFSRRKCQLYANRVTIGLTNNEEQAKISHEVDKYLVKHSIEKSVLEKMPQVIEIKDLLIKGIGVHHSGLLPVLKEIVEILFSAGLIKVLFATETFAIGVNFPTRTVIFTELTKYCDGSDQPRLLKPDEYLQMSGRAGRRGLDQFGTVIHLPLNEAMELNDVRNLLLGKSAKIESKFKINYQFVLQLLFTNKCDTREVTQQSYMFKQQIDSIAGLNDNLKALNSQKTDLLHFISTLNLTSSQIDNILQLISLEKKLLTPTEMNGFIIKQNKNQEKKIKMDIEKISKELSNLANLEQIRKSYKSLEVIEIEIANLQKDVNYYEKVLFDSYRKCVKELYNLGYISEYNENGDLFEYGRDQLTQKGVIAAHIVSANEILLTELIEQNKLENLDLPSLAAILSLFCEEGRTTDDYVYKENLLPEATNNLIDWIYGLSEELSQNNEIYSVECQEKTISDTFVNVCYLWAQGSTYFEIMPYLETFEGNFVRNMLRLSHICDEILTICKILQRVKLEKKINELKVTIIRDIVTFDSLYLKI